MTELSLRAPRTRPTGRLSGLKAAIAAAAIAATAWTAPTLAADKEAITADEAHSIGVTAYTYLYPLISMELTRQQFTNLPAGSGVGGPMNAFANTPAYPTADLRVVVRPNFDTLYSNGWLDMTKEPVVVTAPDTGGRYYLLPMLDMWTDVFASPGWRTTGTGEGHFLIVPPGWRPELRDNWLTELKLPEGTERIDAPTPYVWIIGRTKTDGPDDYDAVHKIQAGYRITPLSQWGKAPEPVKQVIDPSVDVKTPPKLAVDRMPAAEFFALGARLMGEQPPHITDQPILAQMKRLGIEPGKPFDLAKADPAVRAGLETAPADAQALMGWKLATLASVVNGWSMNTDTMGVYGNYYLKRAIVSQIGLGANLPEDAIYPQNLFDSDKKPLDGASNYTIHFDKAGLPPVDAFWSITLYDSQGFQVANPINRFAVSSWMPFHYNADGSLDLYVQDESPGADKEANWLPAPKEGPFNLTMRLYAPQTAGLTGKWSPPPVVRDLGLPSLTTQ